MNILEQLTEEEFHRIEAYLNGSLSETERQQFEKELAKDSQLQDQVEQVRALQQELEEVAFRVRMENYHASIKEKAEAKGKVRQLSRTWYWAAAIAAVVLLIFVWGPFSMPQEKIFKDYFYVDPGLPTPMSTEENYDFNEAMVDYKRGNYEVALTKWEKQLEARPESDTLHYFIGMIHLNRKAYKEALPHLDRSEIFKDSPFEEEAAYYGALAYLKEKEVEKAIHLLENHPSAENKKLLDELNALKP